MEREIAGAARQRFGNVSEQREIGGSGENEPSRLALLVHTLLQRNEQIRAALDFIENYGASQQRFRV